MKNYKRLAGLLITLSFILGLANPCFAKVKGNIIEVNVKFEAPEITQGPLGARIEMKDTRSIANPGEPVLPVKTVRVLIPEGKRIKSSRVIYGNKVTLEGVFNVECGQQEYPLSKIPKDLKPTSPNKEIYESDNPFPGKAKEHRSNQKMRGYDIAIFNLFPVEYKPLTGELSYYEEMTLIIELESVVTAKEKIKRRDLPEDKEKVKDFIDNPEDTDTFYPLKLNKFDIKSLFGITKAYAALTPANYKYVVITNETFKNAPGPYNFQALCKEKEARGITWTIVTTEYIYANYSGLRPDGNTDNATKIRNFIIDAYNNWQTEYILLGGDGDGQNLGGESEDPIIPARGFKDIGDDNIPADLYYACLDGTFDNDKDGLYGEPTDGPTGGEIDLIAEVYVGRGCVDSVTELANFVRKSLAYQKDVPDNLNLAYMLGEQLGFGGISEYATAEMEEIRLGSDAHGYTTVGFVSNNFLDTKTLYDSPTFTWSKTTLINLINSGVHILSHAGHSWVTYVMKLSNSDVDNSLTNTQYFLGSSSLGCYTGAFDNRSDSTSYYNYDCIAEHLTTQPSGAFAFIGNSRYGWGTKNSTNSSSQYYQRRFWDNIFGKNNLILGKANQFSKEDNIGYLNYGMNRWCYYTINLFGDPEITIKVKPFDITASISSPKKEGFIKGIFNIIGDAYGSDFNSYELSYFPQNNPNQVTIINSSNIPVSNGVLGVLDVTSFNESNYYTIRLKVFGPHYTLPYKYEVNVKVDNYNEPPIILPENKGAVLGRLLEFKVPAFDPDDPSTPNGKLRYEAVGLPDGATFDPDTGVFSWTPTLTENGIKKITFKVSDGGGSVSDAKTILIYLYDIKEIQITTSFLSQYMPAIYGDKIVWIDAGDGNAHPEVYFYDLSTQTETRITTDSSTQYFPAIYGDKIVWQDWRNSNSDIYLYDLLTKIETPITTNTADQKHPAIYGDKIVWEDLRNGNYDIYLYDLITKTETKITTNTADQEHPAIYGDKIVWEDLRNGNRDIYLYDLSTRTETYITANSSIQRYPAIYGDKIVWQDLRNGNRDIYLYDFSTKTEIPITTNTADQYVPAIYGDKIVWQDWRNGNWDIYLYDFSTKTEIPITIDTRHQEHPAIYGDKIVWEDWTNENEMLDIYIGIVTEKFKRLSLNPIGNNSVDEGKPLIFNITATDLDGDPLLYEAWEYRQDYDVNADGNLDNLDFVTIGNHFGAVNPDDPESVRCDLYKDGYVNVKDLGLLGKDYGHLPTGASFDQTTHTFSWTPTYDQAGTYKITFSVSDLDATGNRKGGIDSETITITVNNVDIAPPTTPGTPYLSSGTNPNNIGTFSISWSTSTDTESGLKGYVVYRIWNDLHIRITSVNTNIYYETNLSEGSYTYIIYAVDNVNNYSSHSETSVAIIVDKTLPTITNISDSPDPFYVKKGQVSTIKYSLGDNLSTTLTVYTYIYTSGGTLVRTLGPYSQSLGANSVTWNGKNSSGTYVANGTYKYRIKAIDAAGNYTYSGYYYVTKR